MKKILFAICLLSAAVTANAGGFQVNTQGQKALGMGGAFTAYNKDASAVYYNPGAVAMLDSGRFISIGSTFVMSRTAFRSTATEQIAEMETQKMFPSYLYVSLPVAGKLSAGLSINSPYGIHTKWDDNWEGRAVVQEMSLQTYYVQPTLSYRISNTFSVGAGLVYGWSDLLVRRQIGEFNGNAKFESQASGFGFNAGIFGKIQDEISFGITYRSGIKLNQNKGEATFTNIPAFHGSTYSNQTTQSELNLPSTLSVGFSNRINSKVVASFEFNLTGWSTYDSLNFTFENTETPDVRAGRRYEDAMAFRVGVDYTRNEKLTLRAGAYFDESPIRDEFVTPDIPDGTRLGLTAGLSYKLSDRFELDAAYVYENISERRAKANEFNPQISNIGGAFRSNTHGIGLGLNYKF